MQMFHGIMQSSMYRRLGGNNWPVSDKHIEARDIMTAI